MDFVICPDNNYAEPAGVLICSICRNACPEDGTVRIHVVTSPGFDKSHEDTYRRIASGFGAILCCRTVPEDLWSQVPEVRFSDSPHVTKSAFNRFFLPEILSDADCVVYLDCDVVVTDSLAALSAVPETALAAVPVAERWNPEWYGRLRLDIRLGYFRAC